MTLALETLGSHKALDLGGLGVVRLALTSDGAADDELADIVLLVETEELADVRGTLGAESLGVDDIREAGDVVLTLLDDGKGKDGEVETGDGWGEEYQVSVVRLVSNVGIVGALPPRILLRLRSPVRRGR